MCGWCVSVIVIVFVGLVSLVASCVALRVCFMFVSLVASGLLEYC